MGRPITQCFSRTVIQFIHGMLDFLVGDSRKIPVFRGAMHWWSITLLTNTAAQSDPISVPKTEFLLWYPGPESIQLIMQTLGCTDLCGSLWFTLRSRIGLIGRWGQDKSSPR